MLRAIDGRILLTLGGGLIVGLTLGFAAGAATSGPPVQLPSRPQSDTTPHLVLATGATVGMPQPRSWPALNTAREILGPDVADAVMYVDAPDHHAIVALRPDTAGEPEEHDYHMVLLDGVDGRYVPRPLPIGIVTNFGDSIGTPSGDGSVKGAGRLWGVEDADGDGRMDVWAAEVYTNMRADWSLDLRPIRRPRAAWRTSPTAASPKATCCHSRTATSPPERRRACATGCAPAPCC